jgi:carbon monoxide dehydrogenase subunit G
MTAVVESIEIARRPEAVFSYATDFSHFSDWQAGVVSARLEDGAPLAVGSQAAVTRRVGGRELSRTEEVVEFAPPRSWTVRGRGGPLTATARGTIKSLAGGERSGLTIGLDFEGRGIGKLLVPLVRRQARKELRRNQRRLKAVLERPRGES